MKKVVPAIFSLTVATAIWLPCLHVFFKPDLRAYRSPEGIAPEARALASAQMDLWLNPDRCARELERMRKSNAEWDFMSRTFFVLSLANMGFRDPGGKRVYLEIMDRIIDETIKLEKEHGIYYFRMDYARAGSFVSEKGRSLFLDGEIALMIGVRRLLEENEAYRSLLPERISAMVEYMQESPVLSGESYPDECWMFCNSIALVAIRISDVLNGTDHSVFLRQWLDVAKGKLVDERTGLLISSFSFEGIPYDGPEGSSIWMVAHCLQVIDKAFAADQYRRARSELAVNTLGFGYAREWPATWRGPMDIDSGPIVPALDISAGSSGQALIAACAFGDDVYLSSLLTSLNFGGFPVKKNGRLRYCAGNSLGDAVSLYSMVLGPVWDEIERRDGS